MSTVQARAAARLYTGSVTLTKRLGHWLAPEQRPVAATIRVGATGWLGLHLGPAMIDHPGLLASVGACWCWAAWRTRPTEESEQDPDEQAEDDGPRHTAAEIRDAVHRLLHAAVAGRNGVHVVELLGELQTAGLIGTEVTVAELRRALEGWGIPVRDSLKVSGLNRPGIHRDDLQPLPEPLPQPVLVTAG